MQIKIFSAAPSCDSISRERERQSDHDFVKDETEGSKKMICQFAVFSVGLSRSPKRL